MTAGALARELEVSTRTVLRDIESLSAAGVPVYAERGRNGGFALLPGFETELTGLNEDEALALLVDRTRARRAVVGAGLGAGFRGSKVIDALPRGHRAAAADAAHRLLVAPADDLVTPVRVDDDGASATLQSVRRAVLSGRRLRIHYQATGESARWRVVDPIGLVSVRDRAYLLAMRDGAGPHLPALACVGRARARRAGEATGPGRSRPGCGGNAARSTCLRSTTSPRPCGSPLSGRTMRRAPRWRSAPRSQTRTAGCGCTSPSRTRSTPSGHCGSSPRTWRSCTRVVAGLPARPRQRDRHPQRVTLMQPKAGRRDLCRPEVLHPPRHGRQQRVDTAAAAEHYTPRQEQPTREHDRGGRSGSVTLLPDAS
jgi:hypothetical protein